MVGVEGREVVAMSAAEGGVFLEQSLLYVEAVFLRLAVLVAGGEIG